jgi:hypothetical protein
MDVTGFVNTVISFIRISLKDCSLIMSVKCLFRWLLIKNERLSLCLSFSESRSLCKAKAQRSSFCSICRKEDSLHNRKDAGLHAKQNLM